MFKKIGNVALKVLQVVLLAVIVWELAIIYQKDVVPALESTDTREAINVESAAAPVGAGGISTELITQPTEDDDKESPVDEYLKDPHCVYGFNETSVTDRDYDITEEKRFGQFYHLNNNGDYHIYDKILDADIDEIDRYGIATPCTDNEITFSYGIYADDGVIKSNSLGGLMRYIAFHTDKMDAAECITIIYCLNNESHMVHSQVGGGSFTGAEPHEFEDGYCPICGYHKE